MIRLTANRTRARIKSYSDKRLKGFQDKVENMLSDADSSKEIHKALSLKIDTDSHFKTFLPVFRSSNRWAIGTSGLYMTLLPEVAYEPTGCKIPVEPKIFDTPAYFTIRKDASGHDYVIQFWVVREIIADQTVMASGRATTHQLWSGQFSHSVRSLQENTSALWVLERIVEIMWKIYLRQFMETLVLGEATAQDSFLKTDIGKNFYNLINRYIWE